MASTRMGMCPLIDINLGRETSISAYSILLYGIVLAGIDFIFVGDIMPIAEDRPARAVEEKRAPLKPQ